MYRTRRRRGISGSKRNPSHVVKKRHPRALTSAVAGSSSQTRVDDFYRAMVSPTLLSSSGVYTGGDAPAKTWCATRPIEQFFIARSHPPQPNSSSRLLQSSPSASTASIPSAPSNDRQPPAHPTLEMVNTVFGPPAATAAALVGVETPSVSVDLDSLKVEAMMAPFMGAGPPREGYDPSDYDFDLEETMKELAAAGLTEAEAKTWVDTTIGEFKERWGPNSTYAKGDGPPSTLPSAPSSLGISMPRMPSTALTRPTLEMVNSVFGPPL